MEHTEDMGTSFGTWPDPTARLMYHDVMPFLLSGLDTRGRVADYGGANGLLKEWIPHCITVDYDETKLPDVIADIQTHVGDYDLVTMRYVLHYMPDADVTRLFSHLALFHKGQVFVVQFVNDDLEAKRANSVGEEKWFRGEGHLARLITSGGWRIVSRRAADYEVGADFYRWRLGHPNPTPHKETAVAYVLELR